MRHFSHRQQVCWHGLLWQGTTLDNHQGSPYSTIQHSPQSKPIFRTAPHCWVLVLLRLGCARNQSPESTRTPTILNFTKICRTSSAVLKKTPHSFEPMAEREAQTMDMKGEHHNASRPAWIPRPNPGLLSTTSPHLGLHKRLGNHRALHPAGAAAVPSSLAILTVCRGPFRPVFRPRTCPVCVPAVSWPVFWPWPRCCPCLCPCLCPGIALKWCSARLDGVRPVSRRSLGRRVSLLVSRCGLSGRVAAKVPAVDLRVSLGLSSSTPNLPKHDRASMSSRTPTPKFPPFFPPKSRSF